MCPAIQLIYKKQDKLKDKKVVARIDYCYLHSFMKLTSAWVSALETHQDVS